MGQQLAWANATVRKLRQQAWPTIKYLTRTDVHTFAFSVAANAILSFFPFVVLLLTLSRTVFHSQAMFDVIVSLLRDYLPTGQDFIVRNLREMVYARHKAQVISVFILLFTSTGVFLPLEVALNEVWGFKKNRSYLGNQIIALALAIACGVLAMISIALAAGNQLLLGHILGDNIVSDVISFVVMKVFAIACTVSIFFLIYWILPHGKVSAKAVFPSAFVMGVIMEVAKYVYILSLPWLNFKEVYGPFNISVTLIFWAFLSGMMLLAGAHLSALGAENGATAETNGH
ncbi:MAG TPA: YihY/virulence factor BrkB family protein [Terriglobales bacterium]|nr:YihY/virulence factor BrkB family protein [Terriglobales bacterium]